MLCNSLIRCTMIYGLHTKELPRNLLNQLETYMYKHIRTMMNPRWKDDSWYPGKKQLYKTIQQSTMGSWINKTQVMTMLMQTQDTQTIHQKQCVEMLTPKQKLQEQWRTRNNAIKENAPQRRKDSGNEVEYTKIAEQAEIMQLLAVRPEMPGESNLNGGNREKLAELILEYPAKAESQEDETKGKEQRRRYTCIKCEKPFKTPTGKTNRLRNSPECRQLLQKGNSQIDDRAVTGPSRYDIY